MSASLQAMGQDHVNLALNIWHLALHPANPSKQHITAGTADNHSWILYAAVDALEISTAGTAAPASTKHPTSTGHYVSPVHTIL